MTISELPPNNSNPTGIRIDAMAWPVADLVDDVLAAYVDWRHDARAVTDACHRWVGAAGERPGRTLRGAHRCP